MAAVSSNADNFFQTTSSIADNERRARKAANTQGSPFKFPSKLLALDTTASFHPTSDIVLVAEAGGFVSALKLSTNEVLRLGKGSQAPLTSLAHYAKASDTLGQPDIQLFAGGWNKSITTYAITYDASPSLSLVNTLRFTNQTNVPAHQDFVKCLLVSRTADGHPVLLSGGADGDLNIFSLENGRRLTTIKPQCRGIESLALDPYSDPSVLTIFFSTSQREIFSITLPALADLSGIQLSSPIVAHETSVYKLHFDRDGDLWTASADKTAKHLVREGGWTVDTTLAHPDFVRDIVTHERYGLVITACRDEEIRVWNGSTGALYHVFTGHYEEVTSLGLVGDLLVSISIDATLRRWSLAPEDLRAEVERAKNPRLLEDEPEPRMADLGLTAEEEAELKALMESEEEDALNKMAMDDQ